MKKVKNLLMISTLVCSVTILNASWSDSLGGIMDKVQKVQQLPSSKTTTNSSSTASNLSTTDMNGALKQALNVGVDYAVKSLGAKNGYLNNPLTKIGLPKDLEKTANIVRKVGGGKYVDDLILALNNAATQAAPKTAKIFTSSISKMSINDAKQILNGSDDAATNYFRTHTTKQLQQTIAPIIKKSMQNNSVAKYYKAFQSFYKSNAKILKNDKINALASSFGYGSVLPSNNDEDLDSYVTNKSIDGLMTMIAQKEKAIRSNPMMQNSKLIKKVFSAF
jgi:ribosomal protein L22